MNENFFVTPPFGWQKKAFNIAHKLPEYALLADMGTGKTKCAIDLLRSKYAQEMRLLKTVIFSPLVTLYNWKNEFQVHSKIDKNLIHVLDSSDSRIKDLRKAIGEGSEKSAIIIVNYEAAINTTFQSMIKAWNPEIILCDEMHYIKSYKSQRAKAIVKIADSSLYRFGLTGTPILNDAMDIFMQYKFLDKGESFGSNFFKFRSEYFEDTNASWASKKAHFPNWKLKKHKIDEMNSKIYSKAFRVTKDECLDLPPLIKETVKLPMKGDMLKAYLQMQNDFITFVEDQKTKESLAVVAQLALTKSLRLLQITSGFAKSEEGVIVRFKYNPKIMWLEDALPNMALGNKVILWCAFKEDYTMLSELCDKLKIKYCMITGEQSLDEKQESIDSITKNDDVRVVIANRRAGGIGINLVECKYSVVYSRNASLSDELQSEARNYRSGSQMHDKIVKIDLTCQDSIDELYLSALQGKFELSEIILKLTEELCKLKNN